MQARAYACSVLVRTQKISYTTVSLLRLLPFPLAYYNVLGDSGPTLFTAAVQHAPVRVEEGGTGKGVFLSQCSGIDALISTCMTM